MFGISQGSLPTKLDPDVFCIVELFLNFQDFKVLYIRKNIEKIFNLGFCLIKIITPYRITKPSVQSTYICFCISCFCLNENLRFQIESSSLTQLTKYQSHYQAQVINITSKKFFYLMECQILFLNFPFYEFQKQIK